MELPNKRNIIKTFVNGGIWSLSHSTWRNSI